MDTLKSIFFSGLGIICIVLIAIIAITAMAFAFGDAHVAAKIATSATAPFAVAALFKGAAYCFDM